MYYICAVTVVLIFAKENIIEELKLFFKISKIDKAFFTCMELTL